METVPGVSDEQAVVLRVALDDEQIEAIARRAAQLVPIRNSEPEGLLDTKAAARYLNTSQAQVLNLVSQGRLRRHKLGTANRYEIRDLNALLRKGQR